jgi:hypothetical protein
MVEGWQEEHGDLFALLYCHVVNSGMNRPRGGTQVDRVHPYAHCVNRRRENRPKAHVSVLRCLLNQRRK